MSKIYPPCSQQRSHHPTSSVPLVPRMHENGQTVNVNISPHSRSAPSLFASLPQSARSLGEEWPPALCVTPNPAWPSDQLWPLGSTPHWWAVDEFEGCMENLRAKWGAGGTEAGRSETGCKRGRSTEQNRRNKLKNGGGKRDKLGFQVNQRS